MAFGRGDGVIACGGDGTVGVLAATAIAHDGLLAVVPTGSGNDFARHLRLDHRHPERVLTHLRTGREVRVDLGRATTRADPPTWFCSVASTGLDAAANAVANRTRYLRGTPLYVSAMLRTLASYRPRRYALVLDDAPAIEFDAWLVAFANTRSYGSGMQIAPHARHDDGLLDIITVGPVTRGELLRTFPRVFRGSHLAHPQVQSFRARSASIHELGGFEPGELYASGDPVGPLPARVEIVPNALRLLLPG